MHANAEIAIRYHEAVAAGAVRDELARFFHHEAVHHQLPNLLFPHGLRRDLSALLAAAEQGRDLLVHQEFEVINAVVQGDRVALEARWSGTLAVPMGELPTGHVLRAHIAAFLDFRDGRILAQRNYDCYEPLG